MNNELFKKAEEVKENIVNIDTAIRRVNNVINNDLRAQLFESDSWWKVFFGGARHDFLEDFLALLKTHRDKLQKEFDEL